MRVSEFARAANLTTAAAYDLLRQDKYKDYVSTINGVKDVSNELLSILTTTAAADKDRIQTKPQKQEQEEIESLKKQIQELQQEIKDRDRQIADFAIKFSELAQQAQVLAGQAQVLQAAEKKELPPPQEKKKSWFSRILGE